MASMLDHPLVQKILDKFSSSREFTISAVLHLVMVALFGTAVMFEVTQEPPDFEGEGGGFVGPPGDAVTTPPQSTQVPQETTFEVTTAVQTPTTSPVSAITTTAANPLNFEMTQMIVPVAPAPIGDAAMMAPPPAPAGSGFGDGMTPQIAAQIKEFTRGWGTGTGMGTGTRQREFEFFAFVAEYSGGDWNSTLEFRTQTVKGQPPVRIVRRGSMKNLLWIINHWSRDKIKTNDNNIQVVRLDSDEIFSIKPPFVFMTGTRDFTLSEQEVENLRKYVRMGGCIWGDSSLPGRNSRFDIAFRREMRRVIPDVDKDFEPLPKDHPIFTAGYFPEIKEVPAGINFYREPVYALSIYGEIGILYTSNDYGDMWQIGLNEKGEVDLRRDESLGFHDSFVAINPRIWDYRYSYIGNITPSGGRGPQANVAVNLVDTYKFGTNIIVHLLTRWDRVVSRAPAL